MIETILLNYLKEKLTVPVAMEDVNASKFVTIEKTGSRDDDLIYMARFAIQSHAESLYEAALLNDNVKKALLGDGTTSYGIEALDEICKCELNSDYNFTDSKSKKYRYQAVYDIVHY